MTRHGHRLARRFSHHRDFHHLSPESSSITSRVNCQERVEQAIAITITRMSEAGSSTAPSVKRAQKLKRSARRARARAALLPHEYRIPPNVPHKVLFAQIRTNFDLASLNFGQSGHLCCSKLASRPLALDALMADTSITYVAWNGTLYARFLFLGIRLFIWTLIGGTLS